MLYAILAYHVEDEIASLTPQQDTALMVDLNRVHDRLNREKRMGPAARLGATESACVLRGPGNGVVTDGPFTESKEQLLGFYVIDGADRDAAIAIARDLREVNPSAIYEIRPVLVYRPGMAFPLTGRTEPGPESWGHGDRPTSQKS
ncbi:MAG TPA: YciI family protein [Bradyrhizobium sp.]|jgi:hypothetical protein|uniref:YciI family protein n=1 Tax=Bradyrhizobium sp. TaxID=376 RepID=UPI002C801EBC|nr:YciI family protein [Bradyrhizobium sp.]HTB04360.1 YciI family protein [Bradyrhizobium sp.]